METSPTPAPAPQAAVSTRARTADGVAIVVLIVIQLAGAVAALLSCIVLPMSIDNCTYQACGDEKWIAWAIWMQIAAVAVAGALTAAGLIMLVRRRIGFWLPLLGCVIQWAVIVGAWHLAAQSGPLH
ncbi:DUF6264 family protein [Mycolicibacterium aubagnense]|uniref:Uncharacterized protein n=1 Tax=Mycolicibacterium aubagnense TaxID=319707 RepID=A0ABN5Z0G5_9MYCO|nr:DUF6264 family protein [Mycolicibacterium aubagnense]TLH65228.1 hypothetical protein C1S80_09900 [Mycolicibacterium aubagnense]WGI31171.1 hypothetical protein QDT91_18145 [Mycolicibacterium aubagnense]BBX87433.1 hypothetical protein MAUB_53060 [Mycolicibacterium aubagnense]